MRSLLDEEFQKCYCKWVNPNDGFPVDTRRRFNVYKTSIRRWRRRIDVLETLKRRRVSTDRMEVRFF